LNTKLSQVGSTNIASSSEAIGYLASSSDAQGVGERGKPNALGTFRGFLGGQRLVTEERKQNSRWPPRTYLGAVTVNRDKPVCSPQSPRRGGSNQPG
jgi:hypothetical protein